VYDTKTLYENLVNKIKVDININECVSFWERVAGNTVARGNGPPIRVG